MKTGQVVKLKNGGPLMAVVDIEGLTVCPDSGKQLVDCVWFEGKAFVRGKFSACSLQAVSSPAMAGQAA
jgi:uncharacterized protein YodC (DUF2158 family)